MANMIDKAVYRYNAYRVKDGLSTFMRKVLLSHGTRRYNFFIALVEALDDARSQSFPLRLRHLKGAL